MILFEIQHIPSPSQTDWIQTWVFIGQLIATIGGFILLYRTLRLQTKATGDQHEITSLEYKKFLYDIRPVFEFWAPSCTKDVHGNARVQYFIICKRNIAIDYSIKSFCIFKDGRIDSRILNYVNIDLKWEVINGNFSSDELKHEVLLILYFSDEINTEYKQIVKGNLQDLQISPPFPVSKQIVVNDIIV